MILDKPVITIITVVYNDVVGLKKTIESVLNQNFKNFEFIIIDGFSSDGTSDLIQNYLDNVDKYICEIDNGITDAFNKGLKLATGDWIYFLNSGDYLVDEYILDKIYYEYLCKSNVDIVSGKVRIVDNNGIYLGYNHPNTIISIDELFVRNIIAHQATFVRLSLFNQIGGFKEYKINMDYDFWIRAKIFNAFFLLIDLEVANFSCEGISSNRNNFLKARKEMLNILKGYNLISVVQYQIRFFISIIDYYFKSLIRVILGNRISELISLYRISRK